MATKESNLQCPAIYSFKEEVQGVTINFVRIKRSYGWWISLEGVFFGDWLSSDTPEVFDILSQQANAKIEEFKKK